MKICSKCKIEKSLDSFSKCKTGKLGLHNHCKNCAKETRRNWYIKNREYAIQKSKIASKTPAAKQRVKNYFQENKEKIYAQHRLRRKTPKYRKMANQARNNLRKNNESFRIASNLRTRIGIALKKKEGK